METTCWYPIILLFQELQFIKNFASNFQAIAPNIDSCNIDLSQMTW